MKSYGQKCDFNLSPQGDGNMMAAFLMILPTTFQLIPARGRKRSSQNVATLRNVISTYPRKGTETRCRPRPCNDGYDFNLSPQGDGNLDIILYLLKVHYFNLSPQGDGNPMRSYRTADALISTSPRKGTKNSASKTMRSFSFANLNSLFSVGFCSMSRAAAAFSLPWLSYCDKVCYNRAKSKHLSQNTQTHFLFIVQFFHNL